MAAKIGPEVNSLPAGERQLARLFEATKNDLTELRTELTALRADVTAIRTKLIATLAKLDADAGVTDVNYESTQTPAALTSNDPAALELQS